MTTKKIIQKILKFYKTKQQKLPFIDKTGRKHQYFCTNVNAVNNETSILKTETVLTKKRIFIETTKGIEVSNITF